MQHKFPDVGQNILINFCNLLYLVFLCNFSYFGFRAFISLFFLVHLMFFRSNLIPVMVRYQLRVILDDIFLSVKF